MQTTKCFNMFELESISQKNSFVSFFLSVNRLVVIVVADLCIHGGEGGEGGEDVNGSLFWMI